MQCAVCYSCVPWMQLDTAWIKFTPFNCFQLFVFGFIFSLKKCPYLKNGKDLLYSKTNRLVGFSIPSLSFFFLMKKVVLWSILKFFFKMDLSYLLTLVFVSLSLVFVHLPFSCFDLLFLLVLEFMLSSRIYLLPY